MSKTVITLDPASATVKAVVNAVRYTVGAQAGWSTYVAEQDVTRETVKDHADALAALSYPNDDRVQTVTVEGKKVRTRYGNAVQAAKAGLNYALGKSEGTVSTALLTSAGKKATRDEVIAAWEAAQK